MKLSSSDNRIRNYLCSVNGNFFSKKLIAWRTPFTKKKVFASQWSDFKLKTLQGTIVSEYDIRDKKFITKWLLKSSINSLEMIWRWRTHETSDTQYINSQARDSSNPKERFISLVNQVRLIVYIEDVWIESLFLNDGVLQILSLWGCDVWQNWPIRLGSRCGGRTQGWARLLDPGTGWRSGGMCTGLLGAPVIFNFWHVRFYSLQLWKWSSNLIEQQN